MPKRFNFVLTGKVAAGHTRAAAAAALSKLMRVPEARALELLAGTETVIKRDLDEAALAPYLGAFGPIGVEVRADEVLAAPAAPAIPAAPAAPAAAVATIPLAPAETVTCPACGAVQPKRNLCRQCGGDMRRLAAAKTEAASAPSQPVFATTAVRVESETFTPHPLNLFSFSGRIGRLRYLAYAFPAYLPLIAAVVIGRVTGSAGLFFTLLIVGGIASACLGIRVGVLRFHDLNRSGLWVLLPVLPVLLVFTGSKILIFGSLALLVVVSLALVFWPGSTMTNDYGPPPGPNTVWTIVGAALLIMLAVIGGFSGGKPQMGDPEKEGALSAPSQISPS